MLPDERDDQIVEYLERGVCPAGHRYTQSLRLQCSRQRKPGNSDSGSAQEAATIDEPSAIDHDEPRAFEDVAEFAYFILRLRIGWSIEEVVRSCAKFADYENSSRHAWAEVQAEIEKLKAEYA